ncbi:hypothetical protein M1563_03225, partial [Patescibacteria group bacterium]|nr:hypothetical protein [Patescibacteria group bacterium]
MKTIITHIRPHLDEVGAIWLIKNFLDGWEKPEISFISAEKGNLGLVDLPDALHIGVGRGKYDEHKGDLEKSSMLLVWEDVKKQGKAPDDYLKRNAIDEFVNWNNLIDNARLPFDEYSVASFIRATTNDPQDSMESIELGLKILDRIYIRLVFKQVELGEWDKRVDFQSRWGKSMAIESANFRDFFAFRDGYNIVVRHNPQTNYIGVTAP